MTGSKEKVQIRQVRSSSGHPANQRNTLLALGLGRIGRTKVIDLNPAVAGMIKTVSHLVVAKRA